MLLEVDFFVFCQGTLITLEGGSIPPKQCKSSDQINIFLLLIPFLLVTFSRTVTTLSLTYQKYRPYFRLRKPELSSYRIIKSYPIFSSKKKFGDAAHLSLSLSLSLQ